MRTLQAIRRPLGTGSVARPTWIPETVLLQVVPSNRHAFRVSASVGTAPCVGDAPQRCDDAPLDTLEQCRVCGCAAGEACTDAGCVGCDTVTAEVSDLNCDMCGCDTGEECRGERFEAVCFQLALEGEACTRHSDCAEGNCSSPHSGPRVCLKAPGTACTSNSDCDLCIAGECQQACSTEDPFCGAGMACSSSGEGFFCRVECDNEGEPCPGVVGTVCESRPTSGGMEVLRCFGADCTQAGFECPTGYACVETVTGQFLGDRCMPD